MRKLRTEVWPYQITLPHGIDQKANDEVFKWCNEAIGLRFKDWFSYSYDLDKTLYAFKDEATLVIFKLKWKYHVS